MQRFAIDTPALILDQDALMRNIRTMKELADAAKVAMRPHYKSHRCPWLARLQMANGAKGITCAKLGEAEDLVAAGIPDVLIANQITVPGKIDRLVRLAGKARLSVCVDTAENIDDLAMAAADAGVDLGVLVEFEVGMNRCGVGDAGEVLTLTRRIMDKPHLHFEGIQAYAGQLSHRDDYEARLSGSIVIEDALGRLKDVLERAGVPVKEISGLSTGTAPLRAQMKTVYTEAQAGSYLFMDASYRKLNLPFEQSLYVLASVVSVKPDAFYTDAGLKTMSVDQSAPLLSERPETTLKFSEEHVSNFWPNHPYSVNDQVKYIPSHCCTNVNLFDRIHLVSGGHVVEVLPVVSRGKSQ